MNDKQNSEKTVREIISKVAGYPLEDIREDIRIRDDLLVDSLKQMEIVARIEHHFGVPLEESKLISLETLGEFFEFVQTTISAESA